MPSCLRRRTTPRVLGAAAAATALVLATALPASAHAELVAMTPANGSTVTSAPSTVTLTFDEGVRAPSEIIVRGPGGRVDDGHTRVVDNKASVAVSLHARPSEVGVYRVAYRVVSVDGHPVAAQESFRYAPPGVPAATSSTGTDAVDQAAAVHPWWWVGGVALVVAVAAGLMLSARTRSRRRS